MIPHELLHVLGYYLVGQKCIYHWGQSYVTPKRPMPLWRDLVGMLFPAGVFLNLMLVFGVLAGLALEGFMVAGQAGPDSIVVGDDFWGWFLFLYHPGRFYETPIYAIRINLGIAGPPLIFSLPLLWIGRRCKRKPRKGMLSMLNRIKWQVLLAIFWFGSAYLVIGVVLPFTALGIDALGQKLWLLVIDGRQGGYSEGVIFMSWPK